MEDTKSGAPERTADAYRRRILETARAMFAERGLTSTRMSDVASAAGLAIGTVYNYFPSKEALLDALLVDAAEDFYAMLDTAVRSAVDPLGRVRALIRETATFVLANRARYRTFTDLGKPPEISAKLGARQAAMYRRYRRYITEHVAQAFEEGAVRSDVDPEQLGFVLMAAQDGLVDALLRDGLDGEAAVAYLDVMLDLLMRGVAV